MMAGFDPLAALHDIHPPPPVSWWPPAPGWWLLGVSMLALSVFAVIVLRRYLRSPSRAARRELARVRKEFERSADEAQLASGLSALARRCALSRFAPETVAGLSGDAWLEFLDRTGSTNAFTRGAGRVLATAPYEHRPGSPVAPALPVLERWIERAWAYRE